MLNVELGSWNHPNPGYVHVDAVKLKDTDIIHDIRKPLPFEEGTVDNLLLVHTLEHLNSWRDTENYLKDYCRVLKVGGLIRICGPNGRWCVLAYLEGLTDPNNPKLTWRKDFDIFQPNEKEFCSVDGIPNVTKWLNFKLMSGQSNQYDVHYCFFDSSILSTYLKRAGFENINVIHDYDSLIIEAIKAPRKDASQ